CAKVGEDDSESMDVW
nr:immunoglobulin heavy chain junction region [Macaca mulatta]